MKKIILMLCVFASFGINAQTYDFKTDQSLLTWTNSGGSNGVSVVSDGMVVSWIADKKPKVEITGASIDANANKYLSITLINNSSEAVQMQVQHDKNATSGIRYYLTPGDLATSLATPTTYVVDLTNAEWTGTMASVALVFRGAGNTNLANPSSSGDIIIQKIEFLSEVPVKDTYLFNSGAYNEGWVIDSGVSNDVASGIMTIVPTVNSSSKIAQNFFKLDPSVHSHLHITYKNESALNNQIRIQWILTSPSTRKGGNINISSSMTGFETLTYDLTTEKGTDWTTAEAIGFQIIIRDTNNGNNSSAGDFLIQSIVFNNSATPPNIFSAETDNDWATATNWSLNEIPTGASNVTIPTNTNTTIGASTAATVNNLDVDSAGSVTMSAGSSLIVNGTSTGNVTYNRTLNFVSGNTNGWHLVSSPVAGQAYNDAYGTTNSLATSGTKRGLATYNDANGAGLKYTYLENDDSNAGTFTAGMGYSMKRTATGTVAFTGTINTADVNGVSVVTANDGYNLLGNPYTSYMSSQTFLNANTNTTGQIWTWTEGGGYTARTAAENFIIAPGQGFFVSVASGSTVDFAESNQASGTDNFQKSEKTEINLTIKNGKLNRTAKLMFFDANVTKGFDWGYEGKAFTGVTTEMEVYTQLLEDNVGDKYQVQSLPKSEMESFVIPLGIKASARELTFSAEALNLPSGLKVFLEDRDNNTFNELTNVSEYKVTLNDALDGVGRFYVHTKSSAALSTDTVSLENVSVYATGKSNLRFVGLSQGKANVKLYNVLGKQVLSTSFTANGVQDISLPKLTSGVYIVQLDNEKGTLNKKIVLK